MDPEFELSVGRSRLSPFLFNTRDFLLASAGAEPNWGPPSASAAGRLQDHAGVVHQSEEDEGHLPHAQPLQHRRHP